MRRINPSYSGRSVAHRPCQSKTRSHDPSRNMLYDRIITVYGASCFLKYGLCSVNFEHRPIGMFGRKKNEANARRILMAPSINV
jgi:hypothetical protein